MDDLFTKAPLFIPGTQYQHVGDYKEAERQLREGAFSGRLCICPSRYFEVLVLT